MIHFVDLTGSDKWALICDSILEKQLSVNVEMLSSFPNTGQKILEIGCSTGQITEYLSTNAIKRILTFDDTCTRISKETNVDCLNNDFVDTLENLRTFYEMFSAKWAKVLANRKVTDMTQDAETLDSEINI